MKNAKMIIGLTGNIATGKSVVRRMLENSGALGLDADVIAHRMIYPYGPAYQAVIDTFGEDLLTTDGQISRSKLGALVFNQPEKLTLLESLIHPAVDDSIMVRILRSGLSLVVIEAIKLLESGIGEACDAIWVSHASQHHQVERLLQTRDMMRAEAENRIAMQPSQLAKIAMADAVINTEGAFKHTWQQIQTAVNDKMLSGIKSEPLNLSVAEAWSIHFPNSLPGHLLENFWEAHADEDGTKVYEQLGMRMVSPMMENNQLRALMIWENWNFTATLQKIIPMTGLTPQAEVIVEALTTLARYQQCELLLLSNNLTQHLAAAPSHLRFEQRAVGDFSYPAWQQAAQKISPGEKVDVWMKILTQPLETIMDHPHKRVHTA